MQSTEWIIRRTCTDKKSYSREEADEIIDKRATRGECIYWYKCQFCMRFHLSRQATAYHRLDIVGGQKCEQNS